jgi:hypothetical protein
LASAVTEPARRSNLKQRAQQNINGDMITKVNVEKVKKIV